MSFEIQQVWHHIEDSISPSEVQTIRQVMDIYLYGDVIDINFEGQQIFGLQLFGRNQNQELAFIHENNTLKVNIGRYKWPNEMEIDPFQKPRKHVKMEIKYLTSASFTKKTDYRKAFQFIPLFIRSSKDYFRNIIIKFPKIWSAEFKIPSVESYKGSFQINWPIRPEFTIKLPLGLKIIEQLPLELCFVRIYPEGYENHKTPFAKPYKFHLKNPQITRDNEGRRLYAFVINKKDYDIILKTPKYCEMKFIGEYRVFNEDRFLWIPIFGILLIPFMVLIIINSLINENGLLEPATIIAFLSYLILTLTLEKEGYELPFNKSLTRIKVIILILFVIWFTIFITKYIK